MVRESALESTQLKYPVAPISKSVIDQARRNEFRTIALVALSVLYDTVLRMVRKDQDVEDLV